MTWSNSPNLGSLCKEFKSSATLALAQQARELAATGSKVYNFTVGEPDFNPPDAVIHAAKKAIDDGYHKYTASDGMPLLKEAIIKWHEQTYMYRPKNDEVVATSGAKQAIAQTFFSILSPGDEVIITAPYWVSYPTMVRIAGGVPVVVHGKKENKFAICIDDIEAAITDKTKAILINSPNNPSGAVVPEDTMKALCAITRERGLWFMTDDIYCKLTFDGNRWFSAGMCEDARENVVVINGVSKAYAMTGWRIGWLVAPSVLARAVCRLQGQLTSNPNAVAQVAAAAALTDPDAQVQVDSMRQKFHERRDLIVSLLNKIPGLSCELPDGTFYAFADASELIQRMGVKNDLELSKQLISGAGVVCVPGSAFGYEGMLRFSFATDEDTIRAGMEALHEFVSSRI